MLFAREGADVRSLTAMNIRTRRREERAIEKEAMILKEGNSQEDDASAMSDQRAGPAADIPVDAGETDAVVGPSKPHLLQTLGPGLITGASDDDPSGIGTYSQAGSTWLRHRLDDALHLSPDGGDPGAQRPRRTCHGPRPCRKHLQTLPGLATANHGFFALFIANAVNIGADLGAMADATRLLIGGPGEVYVLLLGVSPFLKQPEHSTPGAIDTFPFGGNGRHPSRLLVARAARFAHPGYAHAGESAQRTDR